MVCSTLHALLRIRVRFFGLASPLRGVLVTPTLACNTQPSPTPRACSHFRITCMYTRRLPSEEVFSSKVSDLGLSSNDTVVVYAKKGSFSAPRCWWTFRTFGHERVHILDGGFPAWEASGGR